MMFKILVIQAQNNLSDDRTEFLINDRLSFMRFLGLGLTDRVPDAKTIWSFRERLTKAGAIKALFARFDQAIREAGYIPMSGQIVDASLVSAPRQRNTDSREGRDQGRTRAPRLEGQAREAAPEGPRRPLDAGLRQGADARGRHAARRHRYPGLRLQEPRRHRPPPRLHPQVGRHRRQPPRRSHAAPGAARHDRTPAPTVWADSAYRSRANEAFLEKHGFRSQVHHRKPKGRPMAPHIRRGNASRSKVRAAVEHVFAQQKGPMGLFVRTIGLARAKVKIGMANSSTTSDGLSGRSAGAASHEPHRHPEHRRRPSPARSRAALLQLKAVAHLRRRHPPQTR